MCKLSAQLRLSIMHEFVANYNKNFLGDYEVELSGGWVNISRKGSISLNGHFITSAIDYARAHGLYLVNVMDSAKGGVEMTF